MTFISSDKNHWYFHSHFSTSDVN